MKYYWCDQITGMLVPFLLWAPLAVGQNSNET